MHTSNKNTAGLFFFEYKFKQHYDLNIYSKIGKQKADLKLYRNSGHLISSQNSTGLSNGGSSLGYSSDWLSLKIIKGSESWGAGEGISLALSNDSEKYDYLRITSNYGRLKVKYIHGLLNSYSEHINRFITARGIEWSNNKNIIVGISETIIYSGKNRALDIGYINPIVSHIEVELNRRLNQIGNSNSNAVWQVHTELFLKKKIRFSFNILVDEFVLDKDKELGKEHGLAYSGRLSYMILNDDGMYINLYLKNIFVGTPTFRHNNGNNNFINDFKPLGWKGGSDSEEILLGFNYINKSRFIVECYTGINWSGKENILAKSKEPYSDYLKGQFPSGDVKKELFSGINLNALFRSKHVIRLSIYNNKTNAINLSLIVPILSRNKY